MDKPPLGVLEKVDPHSYWQNETLEFTPWLAKDENIALLGRSIGLDLEVEGTEVRVGSFFADILCRDAQRNRHVLIENQLEKSDPDHLGRLLLYASGLDARTVVWIAPEFKDEHRAALEWLNRVSLEGVEFFGLRIELWRIGDSAVAPKFDVVVQPNDWSKTAIEATTTATRQTEAQRFWIEYWTGFSEFLQESGASFTPPKPAPNYWITYGIGGKRCALQAYGSQRDGHIDVCLDIGGPDATAHYQLLKQQREAIQSELGFPVDWQDKPDSISSSIVIRREVDMHEREAWPDYFGWTLKMMQSFDRVFRPRIGELDATEWVQEAVEP